MNTGRRVVLAILLGCIVSSAAMARGVLYRGAGAVHKVNPLEMKSTEAIKHVMAVIDASNDKAMRFGYKAVFPDNGEQTVAIVLNEGDVLREDGIRRGEAQLIIRSGSHYPQAFESAGTWKATGEDYSFHAEFPREDGSNMEVIVSKELNSPSTMWDAVPDIELNITVYDYPPASENVSNMPPSKDFTDLYQSLIPMTMFQKWEMVSGLDFNAMLRAEDASANDLVEKLFFD